MDNFQTHFERIQELVRRKNNLINELNVIDISLETENEILVNLRNSDSDSIDMDYIPQVKKEKLENDNNDSIASSAASSSTLSTSTMSPLLESKTTTKTTTTTTTSSSSKTKPSKSPKAVARKRHSTKATNEDLMDIMVYKNEFNNNKITNNNNDNDRDKEKEKDDGIIGSNNDSQPMQIEMNSDDSIQHKLILATKQLNEFIDSITSDTFSIEPTSPTSLTSPPATPPSTSWPLDSSSPTIFSTQSTPTFLSPPSPSKSSYFPTISLNNNNSSGIKIPFSDINNIYNNTPNNKNKQSYNESTKVSEPIFTDTTKATTPRNKHTIKTDINEETTFSRIISFLPDDISNRLVFEYNNNISKWRKEFSNVAVDDFTSYQKDVLKHFYDLANKHDNSFSFFVLKGISIILGIPVDSIRICFTNFMKEQPILLPSSQLKSLKQILDEFGFTAELKSKSDFINLFDRIDNRMLEKIEEISTSSQLQSFILQQEEELQKQSLQKDLTKQLQDAFTDFKKQKIVHSDNIDIKNENDLIYKKNNNNDSNNNNNNYSNNSNNSNKNSINTTITNSTNNSNSNNIHSNNNSNSSNNNNKPLWEHPNIAKGNLAFPLPARNEIDNMSIDDFQWISKSFSQLESPFDIKEFQTGCSCIGDCHSPENIKTCQCLAGQGISYDNGQLMPHLMDELVIMDECNDNCKCCSSCNNRVIQNGQQYPLELFKSAKKGWGVRTMTDIPERTFVTEYVGEIITSEEAERRGQKYDQEGLSYLFDMDVPGRGEYCIDAREYGNESRFINHSCDPNLRNLMINDPSDERFVRIVLFSCRPISKGEELTINYNYQIPSSVPNTPVKKKNNNSSRGENRNSTSDILCHCGSENCKKWLWRG